MRDLLTDRDSEITLLEIETKHGKETDCLY